MPDDLQSKRHQRADKNLLTQMHRNLDQALTAARMRRNLDDQLAGARLDPWVETSYVSEVCAIEALTVPALHTDRGRGIAVELVAMYLDQAANLADEAHFGDDHDGDTFGMGAAA